MDKFLKKMTSNSMQLLMLGFALLSGCASMPSTVSQIIQKNQLSTDQTDQSGGHLKSFAIGGKGLDCGMSIACKPDGSCILFGETVASFGNTIDYLAIRTSPDQQILWAKTYDGSGSDRALYVVAASDGGYLLVGLSKSVLATPLKYPDKPLYPLVIKTDASGNVQWARAIQYLSNADFSLYNVIRSSDGGYVFSGYCEGKGPLLFRLSAQGEYLWGRYYELSKAELHQLRVAETSDRQLAVMFNCEDSFGLFLADHYGKPIWGKIYKNEETSLIRAEGVVDDGKSGLVMVAANVTKSESKVKAAVAVIKVTEHGEVLWGHQYTVGELNVPTMILRGNDHDFAITGITGEGVLAYRYLNNRNNRAVNEFMLLIDDNGSEKSSFVSSMKPWDGTNSVSTTEKSYYTLGTLPSSNSMMNFYFSEWQPQKEKTISNPGLFSKKAFKVQQEVAAINSSSVELPTIEVTKFLSINELKVENGTSMAGKIK